MLADTAIETSDPMVDPLRSGTSASTPEILGSRDVMGQFPSLSPSDQETCGSSVSNPDFALETPLDLMFAPMIYVQRSHRNLGVIPYVICSRFGSFRSAMCW